MVVRDTDEEFSVVEIGECVWERGTVPRFPADQVCCIVGPGHCTCHYYYQSVSLMKSTIEAVSPNLIDSHTLPLLSQCSHTSEHRFNINITQ